MSNRNVVSRRIVLPTSAAVEQAIKKAERILPGTPARDGAHDSRWQAIIRIEDFVPTEPEPIWAFAERWGTHPNKDLRTAIGVLLVETLLAHHFALMFPRIERLALASKRFAFTFGTCWKTGQAMESRNSVQFDRLEKKLRSPRSRAKKIVKPRR